jgi:hypothetical protein
MLPWLNFTEPEKAEHRRMAQIPELFSGAVDLGVGGAISVWHSR